MEAAHGTRAGTEGSVFSESARQRSAADRAHGVAADARLLRHLPRHAPACTRVPHTTLPSPHARPARRAPVRALHDAGRDWPGEAGYATQESVGAAAVASSIGRCAGRAVCC
ncbi:hypothetical protein PsYK624_100750 [Phanerochaete sordida]|uniref:Uncharacterized protein n=1 Tax=Phanerochaete sordida TaxID=48140 RepID=A0A9P3LG39_9APHY|nr:hypothetical protein PsYK624_100750 [Phanerochaete sordida]